ncbi:unnamed protein product [Citrullus colocynthis]|uniref:Uncharacterized protein n=1 Tax=Citrullus colocynthis TaxID=252529 RepID=A0ABP0Z8B0_9ROSI
MAHLIEQALIRKLRARINVPEERMDVLRGFISAELLEDHPLEPHDYMHLLASDLDERLAKMDALIEELGRDVCTHMDKTGENLTDVQDAIRLAIEPLRGELTSLQGEIGQLEAAIEERSLMMLNQNLEQSINALEQQGGVSECSLCSSDTILRIAQMQQSGRKWFRRVPFSEIGKAAEGYATGSEEKHP